MTNNSEDCLWEDADDYWEKMQSQLEYLFHGGCSLETFVKEIFSDGQYSGYVKGSKEGIAGCEE